MNGKLSSNVLWFLLLSSPVMAESEKFSPKLFGGMVVGEVSQPLRKGGSRTFTISGIPLGFGATWDMGPNWGFQADGSVLLDVIGRQQIRQGVSATLSYHLLGGAKRLAAEGPLVSVTARNPSSLSLVFRAGLFQYSASDANDPSISLSGSIWDLGSGVEFRRDLGEEHAIGASLLTTVTTVPASKERLSAQNKELLLFWQTYF